MRRSVQQFSVQSWCTIWCFVMLMVPTAGLRADHLAFPVEHGFLSLSYADMRVVERPDGFDLIYVAPDAFVRIGDYQGVMVDQPEIWIDRNSDYVGSKPDYLKAVADLVRDKVIGRLIRGGHDIVERPGPNVVFMRIAVTDLFVRKKKGRTVSYTQIGSQSASRMIRNMIKDYDIIEMSLQMEVVDAKTEELLGAIVIRRGERFGGIGPGEDERFDFNEFWSIVEEYADRVGCRFDNGRLPQSEWTDCLAAGSDPKN